MVRSRLLMLGRHPWLSVLLVSEVVALVVLGTLAWSAWRTVPSLPSLLPEDEITVFPRLDTADNTPLPSAELLRRVKAVPGVRHAAIGNQSPYSPDVSWTARAWTDDAHGGDVVVATYFGSEARLQTLGLRVVERRDFMPVDFTSYTGDQTRMHATGAPAIISASLAKHLSPTAPVIGRRLYIHGDAPLTVVGVVSALPAATDGFAQNPEGFSILLPTVPADARLGPLLLRSGIGNRVRVAGGVEQALRTSFPRGILGTSRSLAADRTASLDSLYPERQRALWTAAGLCALCLLATLLLATDWMARQHRLELSLRMAFGARRNQLVREWSLELAAVTGLGATLGWLLLHSPVAARLASGALAVHPVETASLALACAIVLPVIATWAASHAFSIPPHLVSRSPSVRL